MFTCTLSGYEIDSLEDLVDIFWIGPGLIRISSTRGRYVYTVPTTLHLHFQRIKCSLQLQWLFIAKLLAGGEIDI